MEEPNIKRKLFITSFVTGNNSFTPQSLELDELVTGAPGGSALMTHSDHNYFHGVLVLSSRLRRSLLKLLSGSTPLGDLVAGAKLEWAAVPW